ncbi:MAG: DUF2231 domain-containing protein [Candidatus Viridilinea halotolerans]|uniref:DUF2231 domain-containing protein n=1 Tax=Candidatus Viridilinea halotolerans TaxID=2491704 RepID=A0A426TUU4_9CHLR|nr:MAG: DUF2231 domain-containing protein [Candidatus Viridilinea halotolerans]
MPTLHPFAIHFPLALLLTSTLFTLLALRPEGAAWAKSSYHCLLVGWLSGVLAMITGVADATRQVAGPDTLYGHEVVRLVNAHAFASLAAMGCYGVAFLRLRRCPDLLGDPAMRRGYIGLHALGAALLLLGGWLGGRLVYGWGLGVGG